MTVHQVKNSVGGTWVEPGGEVREIHNPATGEDVGSVRLSEPEDVARAVAAAGSAFDAWRKTPPVKRAGMLLRLRDLLIRNRPDIARTITVEHGKTLNEAGLEVDRAVDNLEVAAGAPSLMMGQFLEDVSAGIDEYCVRQPLGVFAALCPFNFPAMIPFWFMPYALATGNTYVVKPSPRVPMTFERIMGLVEQAGFPPGVVNSVNGEAGTARALLEHCEVRGVSFVGSTPVGRQVYAMAAASGKRAQVQAGAKNFSIVMPDAVLEKTVPNLVASAFDCAGQRCLALSCVLAVGDVYDELCRRLRDAAARLRVGPGLDPETDMGPVISPEARERIEGYITRAAADGVEVVLDGRGFEVAGHPKGNWVGPTILAGCAPEMAVAREEVFGPVLCVLPVRHFAEAADIIHANPYGNAASIFTTSGAWAREFRYTVRCGNLGINIGVAAPMAMFHFSGKKDSFFGDLHAQGRDAIQFFTEGTVVVERWF